MRDREAILKDYESAKALRKFWRGTGKVITELKEIPLSIHCWQGDDVVGLESGGTLTGGIMATGNYPDKARTGDELRCDINEKHLFYPGLLLYHQTQHTSHI
jgi:L-rhamnose isomerase